MAELPPVSLGVHIFAAYLVVLALRRPLEKRWVTAADEVTQPKRQFVFDFLLGLAAGLMAASLNVMVHGFPAPSTLSLIYGVLIYSFFISQGRIRHIDFHIRVVFDLHTLEIEAKYQMQEPVHGSLYLDSFKLEMLEAQVDGRPLEWEFDKRDDVLGERLHLKSLNGESSFVLKFRTSPEARALQWMNETQTLGGKHPFLYSQCQASNARSIFPCQDTPSVRFTYSAQLEVPEGLTGVKAAGLVKGVRKETGRSPSGCHSPSPTICSPSAPPTLPSGSWDRAQASMPSRRASKPRPGNLPKQSADHGRTCPTD